MKFQLKLSKVILCFSLVFCVAGLYGQNSKKIKFGKKLSSRDIVYYLASDELEGRSPGTKGDSLSVDFINSQLQKLGYDTYIKSFGVDRKSVV